jgi:ribosomal protein S18 acetylase RimI-like enzyme
MRLNTNRKNVRAINFYFRQGFVIEKLDPHDSGIGFFADDFLLVRKLP